MKFFTSYEILISFILTVFTGLLYGGIYCASENLFVFTKKIFFIIPNSIRIISSSEKEGLLKKIRKQKKVKLSFIEKNIFEAIIFVFFGIGLLLLSYVALDGYIMLYIFVLCGIFFIVSYRFFGKIFIIIFDKVLGIIYDIFLIFLCLLLLPIVKLLKLVFFYVKKILSPILHKIRRRRSDKITAGKLAEISRALK